jgi:hypothetical protein
VPERAESQRQRHTTQTQRVVENNLQAGLGSIASDLEGNLRDGALELRFRTREEVVEALRKNHPDLSDDDVDLRANLAMFGYEKDLERLRTLEEAMEAFKRNQPDLSDDDVERIANRVAERVADFAPARTSSSRVERVRKSAHDTAIAVIGGLIATGVLDLIAYFLHSGGVHAAPADEDPSKRTERILQRDHNQLIQRQLLEGLDQRRLYLFENDYKLLEKLGKVTQESLIRAVQASELPDDVARAYSGERRKAAVWLFVDGLYGAVATEVGARVAPKDLSARVIVHYHTVPFTETRACGLT